VVLIALRLDSSLFAELCLLFKVEGWLVAARLIGSIHRGKVNNPFTINLGSGLQQQYPS
jgi:hypothetical protein